VSLPDDEKLSSRHAEAVETADGILVRDLRSTNGTRFSGAPFEARTFRDGEEFAAGNANFRVVAPRFPAARAAAAAPAARRRPAPILAAVVAAVGVLGAAAMFAPGLVNKFLGDALPLQTDPSNLLARNPSFEEGLDGWTVAAEGGKAQVGADEEIKHDGRASLKVRGIETSDWGVFTAASEAVPAEAGAAYRVEGWVRASGLEGFAGFRVEWLSGDRLIGATPGDLLSEGFDWKTMSAAGAAPPGADRVRAACVIAGKVSLVWFDAVKLVKADSAPGGARWAAPWGDVEVDPAARLRLTGAGGAPILSNAELRFYDRRDAQRPIPQWFGRRDGEPQSVGTGIRTVRKFANLGTLTVMAVHAETEESVSWKVDVGPDGELELAADLASSTSLTTRSGETVQPQTGDFDAPGVSEIVLGDSLSLLLDQPASASQRAGRLLLRWPKSPELTLHVRSAPSWIERDLRTALADANAALRAEQLGKAMILFEAAAKRFASRPEGEEAARKAKGLRAGAEELAASARKEAKWAKQYESEGNTRRALEVVDRLGRQYEGTEFAEEAARLRRDLTGGGAAKPPDNGTKPPDSGTKPPEREPIETARKLIAWAEEALAREEYLKAEIFAKNVLDRWPGTSEEMRAGELLGKATAGGRAARERDEWIRETLTRARNLVKNRQPDKAVPLFEEVLKRYPNSPLVKGVAEELEKLR
jgi:hypothetical protein